MTIQELKRLLDAIPPKGAINKARRLAIIIMINKLASGEPVEV